MRVAQGMAGFTYKQADKLRKALGKKDHAVRVPDYKAAFMDGCRANGIPDKGAEEVWSMIETFTGYSFCKPHSAVWYGPCELRERLDQGPPPGAVLRRRHQQPGRVLPRHRLPR